MRIITGKYGGRTFHEPKGHRTHPMSEKIRGALFNVLGDIEGLTFLDAYAGSGALGFEALSRGAKSVMAVEKDRHAIDTIKKSIAELKLGGKIKVTKANVAGWSIHKMESKFDVVMLDPPYEELHRDVLQKLIRRHVKSNGLAVLSWPGHQDAPKFENTKLVENKNYGDAQLAFYRKIK